MSKLEELIQKYCPDGVEWSTIGEVCQKVFAGGTPTSTNSSYYGGDIPWLRSGEVNFNEITFTEKTITEAGYHSSSARWVESQSVLVAMTGATVARSAMTLIKLTANQSVCALVPKREKLNYRYLYYWISKSYLQMKGMAQGALTSLNLNLIKSLEIPVPPLPVQIEIVRILDTFTELQAELQAELQKRVQQYNYYRDNLLSFDGRTDFEWKKLADICYSVKSGKCLERLDVGDYPVYGSTGIIAHSNTCQYTSDNILIARVGANAGYVHLATGKYDVTDNTLVVSLDETKCVLKFIYYYLSSLNLNQHAKGGGQPLITGTIIKDLIIAIPSLEEQERIASILDRFEALTTDLSLGLPAEIEKRRQQYEYYRDQLLTFKRAN